MDLMFRDESSHVIKKAKAKAKKTSRPSADRDTSPDTEFNRNSPKPRPKLPSKRLSLITPNCTSADGSVSEVSWTPDESHLLPSPDSGSWPATPMIALYYSLNPTYQERGTAYFFSRYVTLEENGCHQRFDFVYDVWKPTSLAPERQVDGVLASMTAVGLIGLGDLTRSADLREAARKAYGTALRLTNQALQDPAERVKDSTMLSVLILGLFEMMTDTTVETMKAWQNHVKGAWSLACTRGADRFKHQGGIKMFNVLCHMVLISYTQMQMPMPEDLMALREELGKVVNNADPTWQIATPVYKVLQIRYDIKCGRLPNSDAIIEQLCGIDDEFERILAKFPKEWQYRTLGVSRPHNAVFQGSFHVYPAAGRASVWNSIRSCRLIVLETILCELGRRLSNLSAAPVPQWLVQKYGMYSQKLERICYAILATVPQHIGLVSSLPRGSQVTSTAVSPLSSVTIRETPTPPSTPSPKPLIWSLESCNRRGGGIGADADMRDSNGKAAGPTLLDPMLTADAHEEAKRFMLLASATNSIVWPLYLVGMTSVCTDAMKSYTVERLLALYSETGQMQAEAIATAVREHERPPSGWLGVRVTFLPVNPMNARGGSRPLEHPDQTTLV
ncbi:hypothetical protein VTK73DRAFT_2624 [Phialemonium thermophilum]|uniref:Uncharacterized protein n=1 Tax=Phialemonium thermophilum TaxID=223376 RepID=A0ABR3X3K8_9PEZI